MITVNITDEQVERAKKLYDFGGLRGSITDGKSNIYGAIGEIIMYDFFREGTNKVKIDNTYDYDITIGKSTFDIKTKHTTTHPRGHYNCSVAAFNTKQKCDYYVFCRVTKDLKIGYILGYKKKGEFFETAIFKKKGEIDINGWAFKGDCYNLTIDEIDWFKYKR